MKIWTVHTYTTGGLPKLYRAWVDPDGSKWYRFMEDPTTKRRTTECVRMHHPWQETVGFLEGVYGAPDTQFVTTPDVFPREGIELANQFELAWAGREFPDVPTVFRELRIIEESLR